jgi:hypothetical protein
MNQNLKVAQDGTVPLITNSIKVKYAASEINTNWLLNKILGTKGLQITQIDDDQVLNFLGILYASKLKMPDDTDSLEWLKKRISKRYDQSLSQRGMTWEQISRRYQFILEQIDILLAIRSTNDS